MITFENNMRQFLIMALLLFTIVYSNASTAKVDLANMDGIVLQVDMTTVDATSVQDITLQHPTGIGLESTGSLLGVDLIYSARVLECTAELSLLKITKTICMLTVYNKGSTEAISGRTMRHCKNYNYLSRRAREGINS